MTVSNQPWLDSSRTQKTWEV